VFVKFFYDKNYLGRIEFGSKIYERQLLVLSEPVNQSEKSEELSARAILENQIEVLCVLKGEVHFC
jgi:hypothetical protein